MGLEYRTMITKKLKKTATSAREGQAHPGTASCPENFVPPGLGDIGSGDGHSGGHFGKR
jgi:hypothetical protein